MDDLVYLDAALSRLPLITNISIHRLTEVLPLTCHDQQIPLMTAKLTRISLPSLRYLLRQIIVAAVFLSRAETNSSYERRSFGNRACK